MQRAFPLWSNQKQPGVFYPTSLGSELSQDGCHRQGWAPVSFILKGGQLPASIPSMTGPLYSLQLPCFMLPPGQNLVFHLSVVLNEGSHWESSSHSISLFTCSPSAAGSPLTSVEHFLEWLFSTFPACMAAPISGVRPKGPWGRQQPEAQQGGQRNPR